MDDAAGIIWMSVGAGLFLSVIAYLVKPPSIDIYYMFMVIFVVSLIMFVMGIFVIRKGGSGNEASKH